MQMNAAQFEAAELAQHSVRNGSAQCTMQGKTLQPIEYKVIVKPDLVEETDEAIKRFQKLGMELPAAEKERDKQRQITGTLISVGGNAFEDHLGRVPKIGDKIYFAKYSGYVLVSDDKTEYRLMNDKDITAVLI
jgi:co-chaperonin GroES (HSP10)